MDSHQCLHLHHSNLAAEVVLHSEPGEAGFAYSSVHICAATAVQLDPIHK